MIDGIYKTEGGDAQYVWYSGGNKFWLPDPEALEAAVALCTIFGRPTDTHVVGEAQMRAMGVVQGPRAPGTDEWGNYG